MANAETVISLDSPIVTVELPEANPEQRALMGAITDVYDQLRACLCQGHATKTLEQHEQIQQLGMRLQDLMDGGNASPFFSDHARSLVLSLKDRIERSGQKIER